MATQGVWAGPEGLELLAFGPHHPGDGELVEDAWTDELGLLLTFHTATVSDDQR